MKGAEAEKQESRHIYQLKTFTMKACKGKGGKPSTTGKPSGGGRDNNPPKP